MVIALLASFTQLLLTRSCQHNPCFLGDFCGSVSPTATRKKSQGPLYRMPTLCSVSYGQMAKVVLKKRSENLLGSRLSWAFDELHTPSKSHHSVVSRRTRGPGVLGQSDGAFPPTGDERCRVSGISATGMKYSQQESIIKGIELLFLTKPI